MTKNQSGFTAVESLLIVLVLAVIGFGGYYVWHTQHKSKPAAATVTTTKTNSPTTVTTSTPNPYAGWKTYHSILKSGLSFMYPPNWVFNPLTKQPTPNNMGGVENDSVLYSTAPVTVQGQAASTTTNQFMCVAFDEYSRTGWQKSNWDLGTPLTSQQVNINGSDLTLATYQTKDLQTGVAYPMLDEIVLFNPNDTSSGDHFINTQNGYVVSVSAQYNCGQDSPDGISNLNADFAEQPDTQTAVLIMKSIKF